MTHSTATARTTIPAKNKSQRGASLVEYALLVSLIALVCIAGVSQLGGATNAKFIDIKSKFEAAK